MRPLAGNLAAWPPPVASTDCVYELMVARAGTASMARCTASTCRTAAAC